MDSCMADISTSLRSVQYGREISKNVEALLRRGDRDRAIEFIEKAEFKSGSSSAIFVIVLLVVGALITGLGMLANRGCA
jgi:hypothetical protein